MQYKRSICISVLLSIVLSIASCGSSDSPSITTGTTAIDSAKETTEEKKYSEYVKPNVDFGGKKITIPSYKYDGVWTILNYNILLEEENGDFINDAIVERNRLVEDELNIDLELYPLEMADRNNLTKLTTFILAGEDAFTFALPMACGLAPLMTTPGMLIDLKSIPTLDLTHSWWNSQANSEYTIFGKQLAAVGDICFFNLGAPIVNYFSKKIVEDNKLGNLYDLVYEGKWTIDKMLEMITICSRDLNGDQKMDKEDQFGIACEKDTLSYFIIGAGIRISEHTPNGDIKITLNNEKTIAMCEKLITLFHNSDTTLFSNKLSGYNNTFSDFFMPKLMNNELLFFSNQLHVALSLRNMESDFGILPLAKYDESQKEYYGVGNTYFMDNVIVPATNTDLEMTGIILESMGYYSQQLIVPAFIDKTVMNKSIRDEHSAAMVELVLASQVYDVAYIFDWGKVNTNLGNMATANNKNFSSSYASIENNIKAALEKTIAEMKG